MVKLIAGDELNKIEQTYRLLRQFAITKGYEFTDGASAGNSLDELMTELLNRPREVADWNGYGYKPDTNAQMMIHTMGLDEYNPEGSYYFGANNGDYANIVTPNNLDVGNNNFLYTFSVDGRHTEYKFFKNSDGSQWMGIEEIAPNIYTLKFVGIGGKECNYGAFYLQPAMIHVFGFTFRDDEYYFYMRNRGAHGNQSVSYPIWDYMSAHITTTPQLEGVFDVLCDIPIIALDSAGLSFVGFETWHKQTNWGFMGWSGFDKSLTRIVTTFSSTPFELSITNHSASNWGNSLSWMG